MVKQSGKVFDQSAVIAADPDTPAYPLPHASGFIVFRLPVPSSGDAIRAFNNQLKGRATFLITSTTVREISIQQLISYLARLLSLPVRMVFRTVTEHPTALHPTRDESCSGLFIRPWIGIMNRK